MRPEFGGFNDSTLGALVFELASQLHIERTHRLALEAALASAGIVTPAALEKAGTDADFRERALAAGDLAVRKLLRVISEADDDRTPLRAEGANEKGEK